MDGTQIKLQKEIAFLTRKVLTDSGGEGRIKELEEIIRKNVKDEGLPYTLNTIQAMIVGATMFSAFQTKDEHVAQLSVACLMILANDLRENRDLVVQKHV